MVIEHKKMNHYVYRITNKVEQKHYYGVRGCNVEPTLDLGIKYFSSSTDKDFRDDQKNHPENYKYKIVRICSNREEAGALEKKLHEKFNVGINESFYNRAKQTSTGFDFSGVKHTPEAKRKMSEAKKGENNPNFGTTQTPEHRQKLSEANKGKKRTPETRQKMSEAAKGVPKSDEHRQKISEAQKGENNHNFGKEVSPETRQKLSEANKGVPLGPQEQVQCPHCGKIGGISNMKRWHFDNCKYKESEESEE
jgi:hypothetical protein